MTITQVSPYSATALDGVGQSTSMPQLIQLERENGNPPLPPPPPSLILYACLHRHQPNISKLSDHHTGFSSPQPTHSVMFSTRSDVTDVAGRQEILSIPPLLPPLLWLFTQTLIRGKKTVWSFNPNRTPLPWIAQLCSLCCAVFNKLQQN